MENTSRSKNRVVKYVISFILYLIGSLARICFMAIGKKKIYPTTVIYYHDVHETERARFSHQLDVIKKFSRPLSIHELNGPGEDGIPKVVVTFDDGFSCVKEIVLREAETRGIPFTVFIPTDYMGKTAEWMNKDGTSRGTPTVMSVPDIMSLAVHDGVTIGSHCMSHVDLTGLDDNSAYREISMSKKKLEESIEGSINYLSFPHGAYLQQHLDFAKECGYKQAFGISPAKAKSAEEDFLCGRVRVDPTDWDLEYFLKINGSYRWLSKAIELKRSINKLL
jgi:peptidoglycan/xylan/chitin deacetylase (PgdA/CDA1 family)